MRLKTSVLVCLVFLFAASLVHAGDITVGETNLTQYGTSYQVNRVETGDLFVTDWRSGEVWRVAPNSGAYTLYSGLSSPWDARPDNSGNIWFTQYWFPQLARVNTAANPPIMTTWDFRNLDPIRDPANDYTMGGLAFDAGGNAWFTEADAPTSKKTDQPLYRFNPKTNEVFSYTVTGGLRSYYVISYNGGIWLGDQKQHRIMRFDSQNPTSNVLYWNLEGGSVPRGLAVDAGGDIWWADEGTNKLGRLTPGSNTVRMYPLPDAVPLDVPTPYTVAVREGKIWYTSQGTEAGTIGFLDPGSAVSDPPTTTHGQTTATEKRLSLGAGEDTAVTATSDTFTLWSPQVWTELTASKVGWTVYEMAGARDPYGILADGNRLWVTEQTYNRLVRAILGLTAPIVTVERSGAADVRLTWNPVPGAVLYRVWYSESPYFAPTGAPAQADGSTEYTDYSVAGSATINHFYVVRAVDTDGNESGDANRTGEFSFNLTKGSS